MRTRAQFFLSGCGFAALVASIPAFAQADQGASSPTANGQASQPVAEIVVTAQRRSENIQKVPITVTSISGETLRDRNIVRVQDLTNVIPGLKFGDFAGASNVSIRGIGSAYVSGAGQSSVAVYQDGIYLSQLGSFSMGQGDLGNVEVLEGPQGTLYGRNSTGGVVSFASNKPTKQWVFGASGLIGNYADYKETAYVGGPISDHVRFRLYGEHEDRDGWTLDTTTGQKLNGTKNFGGRFSLDADVSSDWKMELRVSVFKDNYTGPLFDGFYPAFSLIPAPFNNFDPYKVNSPVHYGSSKTNTLVSWKNIFQLSKDITLTSTTGYNRYIAPEMYDGLSNTLLPDPGMVQLHSNAYTQEFNLNGQAPRLKWLAGVFLYDHLNVYSDRIDETNLVVPGPVPHITVEPQATSVIEYGDTRTLEKSASVFGDATYSIFDRTRVYAGARLTYDYVKQDLTQGVGVFAPPVDACNPTADPERLTKTSVTGRAGVQNDLSSSSMVYGQYSHGFKTPGFSQTTCFNSYLPETIDSFEIGYKSQWFDRRLTFNADAFHYRYINQQLEIATLTGIPVVNVPKSHVWGFEANIVAQVLPDIRLDGSVVLLHAVYDEFTNHDPNNGVPAGTNLAGIHLDNSPDAAGNIGLEYRHTWPNVGKFTLRGEVSLTEKYQVREFNEPYAIQHGYAEANAYASYVTPDGHYTVRLFGKNLNKEAVLYGELGFGGALGTFGPPRTYGAEFAVNF